jgi:hypothetical protein
MPVHIILFYRNGKFSGRQAGHKLQQAGACFPAGQKVQIAAFGPSPPGASQPQTEYRGLILFPSYPLSLF